jgi:Protein of unknown function (DUF2878)
VNKLWNFIGFQLTWVAAVGGAARGFWWLGPAALLLFAAYQLSVSPNRRADLRIMLLALGLGLLVDGLLHGSGMIFYTSDVQPWSAKWLAPVWILSLWLAFALALNHSMAYLQKYLALSALMGLIAGPLSYWFAEGTWHAIFIREPKWQVFAALAVAWGLVTPLMLWSAANWSRSPRRIIPT